MVDHRCASASYDLTRPGNSTVEKLRKELRRNNVTFRHSDKKIVLLKKLKDLTLIRSRVEDRPVEIASGSSSGSRNAYQDGGDHRHLMQTILTLTETVSKLQEELRIVSSKVNSGQATGSNAVDTGRTLAQEKIRGRWLHSKIRSTESKPKCNRIIALCRNCAPFDS